MMLKEHRLVHRFGGRRALVIGGSMAGLLAARVLAEHFDEVLIVERDVIGDELLTARKGVPQSRQLHALLAQGERILCELFPGIDRDLDELGAARLNFGNELAWFHGNGWKVATESDVVMVCVSRPTLEAAVRRRVFQLPSIRRMDQHDIVELIASAGKERVTGVRLRRRTGDEAVFDQEADLVVDASGRGAKTGKWLEQLGYSRPEETTVRVDVGYATRFFKAPVPWPHPWKALYVLGAAPNSKRLGVLFPMEQGLCAVGLGGVLGDHPAGDEAGFLEFSKGLPHEAHYNAIKDLEPAGEIATYKFPAHLRRHYERLPNLPSGIIVTGDAFASFNPIFGQGMTTAAIDAVVLGNCLSQQRSLHGRGVLDGFAKLYFNALSKATDQPWAMSTGEDFRYPEVEGKRPAGFAAMKRFTAMVHQAVQLDPVVYKRFIRAMHMTGGMDELLRPDILARVVRAATSNDPMRGAYPFGSM